MTDREEQILSWIKQNPMISQNELAELAGITRSGVAAHISNLMKKGYLRGKGYIVTPPSYVTVIGGINMDIFGVADENVVDKSSNAGHVYYAVGGLGRNIALNLRKLGIQNYFISVYGDDNNGEQFKADALANDMDITYSKQFADTNSSTYLYVNQPGGDRVVGLDDMSINDRITPEFLEDREDMINNSTSVVIDSNLPQQTIEWLYDHCQRPMFAKAVSVTKAGRLLKGIGCLNTLVLNAVESKTLSGIEATDKHTAIQAAQRIIDKGVNNVFLYIDEVGMLYQDERHQLFYPEQKINQRNTNGAGAAATAALVWAHKNEMSFEDSGQLANAAAYLSMESIQAVNENLTHRTLEIKRHELFE
ncbi:Pseudouridine kinase ribokinase-adenosine kinase-pfkB [Furfurilactobacillus rossiae]|uniref:PfkB family carbohydrate kinase n=1 Tax=Furfurilactobacillus rossiae TaxID=231049 RepID=UPI0015BBD24D|nr:PfkB family carbohydrate kinase [Furfurilactobacillus rossiae]MCF6165732.1 PfkB family carbohydrate kinase [Furfurilactobacillus rossiae]QLE63145.1 Pseudouridine kinase ribokinase-adenosine kinase-pfkB [Furfurilactobacillus rossiae]